MSDGYKSRKFWMTVVLSFKFTLLVIYGVIQPETYATLEGSIVLFFTIGNGAEKFAPKQ